MRCPGSGKKNHVSDMNVLERKALCPECHQRVKITIPNRKEQCNVAKFAQHSKPVEK